MRPFVTAGVGGNDVAMVIFLGFVALVGILISAEEKEGYPWYSQFSMRGRTITIVRLQEGGGVPTFLKCGYGVAEEQKRNSFRFPSMAQKGNPFISEDIILTPKSWKGYIHSNFYSNMLPTLRSASMPFSIVAIMMWRWWGFW